MATQILSVIGGLVSLVGLAGGLFTVAKEIRAWREAKRRHGERGASVLVTYVDRSDESVVWEMLVAGDLLHFLRGVLEPQFQGRIKSLEKVGDY